MTVTLECPVSTAPLAAAPPVAPARHVDEYGDVTEMLRRLAQLDAQSPAHRRQREAIVRRCLPLADNIARRYRNRGEAHEDLVQVACVGLMNAVNRFDVESHSDFLPFAVPTMLGEVRRHFRDHGWALKVPRRMKELNAQISLAQRELTHRLHRAPTASEIAQHLDMSREDVLQGLLAANAYNAKSTDVPMGTEDGPLMTDTMGDVDHNIDKVVDVETVRPLLQGLSERERTIIELRFFDDLTQSDIAKRLGISQMHVSRILAKTLSTLRSQIG